MLCYYISARTHLLLSTSFVVDCPRSTSRRGVAGDFAGRLGAHAEGVIRGYSGKDVD